MTTVTITIDDPNGARLRTRSFPAPFNMIILPDSPLARTALSIFNAMRMEQSIPQAFIILILRQQHRLQRAQ